MEPAGIEGAELEEGVVSGEDRVAVGQHQAERHGQEGEGDQQRRPDETAHRARLP
jgi:hypothetical protein